jgi:nuclear pore complex protein Nup133
VEVCFSRPSEARLIFPAVVSVLEKNLAKHIEIERRAITLDTCARGLLVALEAANDFRRRRTGLYPPFSSNVGVNWTCKIDAREALRALSKAAIVLHKEAALSKTNIGLAPVLGSRLMASAAPLLDASAANLNAARPSSTDRIEAHNEYLADRTLVLPTLLECATHSTTVPQQDRPQHGSLTEGVDVSIESVAAVAEAHFGYAQLFEICDAPNGTSRLHHYMRTLLGAQEDGEETFAHFVFRELALTQDRAAALLRDLPVEFHADLERFLASHPDLRWLMELRMGKYANASETLASIGSRDGAVGEKRRMLSMAKLAALAAGGDVEERIESIDASLSA